DFDPGAGTTNLSATNGFYILKLSPTGGFVWARSFGDSTVGGNATGPRGVQTDYDYNVDVAGIVWAASDFDPTPGTTTLPPAGGSDGFVLKLNPTGTTTAYVGQIG